MPEKDGYWLISQVRALPAELGGSTPAACLTGRIEAEDRARVLRAGFQYHIPKPVDVRKMLGIVALLALKA
jgi:CheY-like chemotaxis protein